jgi:hypothetical protein
MIVYLTPLRMHQPQHQFEHFDLVVEFAFICSGCSAFSRAWWSYLHRSVALLDGNARHALDEVSVCIVCGHVHRFEPVGHSRRCLPAACINFIATKMYEIVCVHASQRSEVRRHRTQSALFEHRQCERRSPGNTPGDGFPACMHSSSKRIRIVTSRVQSRRVAWHLGQRPRHLCIRAAGPRSRRMSRCSQD